MPCRFVHLVISELCIKRHDIPARRIPAVHIIDISRIFHLLSVFNATLHEKKMFISSGVRSDTLFSAGTVRKNWTRSQNVG